MTEKENGTGRIDRLRWSAMRPVGDNVPMATTVRQGSVDIEAGDGEVFITVMVQEDGVDIRVGDLDLFVKGTHVSLTQKIPPYPIREWVLLWEGNLT